MNTENFINNVIDFVGFVISFILSLYIIGGVSKVLDISLESINGFFLILVIATLHYLIIKLLSFERNGENTED